MDAFDSTRLSFRRWRPEDAETLFSIASAPDIGPNCGWQPHASLDDSRDFLSGHLMNDEHWAIVRKEAGALMGDIALEGPGSSSEARETGEAEISFWLGHDFEGCGYMSEACMRVLELAFDELGLKTVWIGHHDENLGSARVQEKCGFELHHRIPDHFSQGKGRLCLKTVNWMNRERWQELRERSRQA